MRTSFRGSDEGGALLLAVAMILIFSLLLVSFVPLLHARKDLAEKKLAQALERNQEINQRLRLAYDLR